MESRKQELIYQMLKALFPMECTIAGEPNLQNIVKGVTRRISPEKAEYADISIIIDTLSLAVAVAAFTYNILKDKNKKDEKSIVEELEIIKKNTIETNIDAEKVNNITINVYQFIQENYKNEHKGGERES